jgi:hypothetical protein
VVSIEVLVAIILMFSFVDGVFEAFARTRLDCSPDAKLSRIGSYEAKP